MLSARTLSGQDGDGALPPPSLVDDSKNETASKDPHGVRNKPIEGASLLGCLATINRAASPTFLQLRPT